ncbi:MAG: YfhO family protein [Bryobacterales bacterium]|nr:YfhO family protein [Bryobacterales bacterium]
MRKTWWPYGVLLAEVTAFYAKVLFLPGRYAIPWDLRYYHLPIAQFMARSFERGELPLWDPYTYCGFPIYANLTAGLFYPPMVLSILLSNLAGGRNLLYWLELQLIAHVLLAGILAYGLLRRLGTGRAAALAGAAVYQLGAFFASQNQHLGAVSAAAWLPLAWTGVMALRQGFRWRRVALLAFALGMSLLAGFPAVTAVVYISTFFVALLAGGRRLRLAGACVLAAAWSGWLAAVQLLPTLELTRRSVAALRSEWMEAGGGVPVQALISLLIPNFWGALDFDANTYKLPWNPTFLYLYCGLGGLALAAWALLRRVKHTGLFGAITLIAGLWMLGDKTPAGRILFPLTPAALRGSLYAEFAMAAFTLGMAVLAGLGAERLAQRRRPVWSAALAAVVALDLLVAGAGRRLNTASLADEPGIAYDHFDARREVPETVRRLVHVTWPPSRVDVMNGSINWPGAAPLFEVPSASGNDPFALVRLMQVRLSFCEGENWGRYYQVARPESRVLDLVNVRYLISNEGLDGRLPSPKYRRVADLYYQRVYENLDALPRFFVPGETRAASDLQAALEVIREPGFDPWQTAAVEGLPGGRQAPARLLRVHEYSARRVRLEVEVAGPAFLASSETHYPGWRAFVDGREEKLYYTNGAFRGLPLAAGRHRVEMRFQPSILWRGALLSLAAWSLLALALLRQPRLGALPPK